MSNKQEVGKGAEPRGKIKVSCFVCAESSVVKEKGREKERKRENERSDDMYSQPISVQGRTTPS